MLLKNVHHPIPLSLLADIGISTTVEVSGGKVVEQSSGLQEQAAAVHDVIGVHKCLSVPAPRNQAVQQTASCSLKDVTAK